MSDLTEYINRDDPAHAVEYWYEAKYQPRNRLGLSEVGHKCPRWLWLKHKGHTGEAPEGRILRLFRLGELIEEQAIIDLKSAGYTIHSQQKEVNVDMLTGHIDGVIEGLVESTAPHLLEIKSSSKKRFGMLKEVGYEKWDEKYKAQIHIYMLTMKLNRCLVWVENKDTNEVHTERISLDRKFALNTLERVMATITSSTPPLRACPTPTWYEAKFCPFMKECWG